MLSRSLIVVAVGILIYIMALLFRIFILPVKSPAFSVPYTFAQIFILTGFGLVLYSRLHLITNNTVLLRCLLGMIIVIAFLGHTMSFVQLAIISLNKTLLSRSIMHAISWLDVIFTLQDLILSVAYVYLYWRHMRDSEAFANERSKRRDATTFKLLIAANSVVLLLDIIQNVLLCLKIYIARYMCFPLICAVKLEVEFFVLNRLVKSAEKSSQSLQVAEFSDVASIAAIKGAEAGVQAKSAVSMHLSDSSSGTSGDDSEIKKSNQHGHIQKGPRPDHDQTDYNSMRFLTEAD
jgi:hypothetical protein